MTGATAVADRRGFLIRITGGVCGGAAATLLPVSLLEAGEVCHRMAMSQPLDRCGDWTVDDMCNAYPGYAYDMHRAGRDAPRAPLADVDLMWGA